MKLKSIVSAALILSMTAGIAGCGLQRSETDPTTTTTAAESSETTTETSEESKESKASEESKVSETSESKESGESKPAESTKTTESSKASESKASESKTTETSSSDTTKETGENSGLATVSIYNAYKRTFKKGKKSYKTQYPKIMVANVNTSKVNKEIADKFKPIAKKNNSRVGYTYYVRKYLISVVVFVEKTPGNSKTRDYYVYNVSRINGKKLTRAQVLKSLGMKDNTFNVKVKASVQNYWKNNFKKDTSAEKKEMEKKSVTIKSLNGAMPYMNTNGKISYVLRQVQTPNGKVDLKGTC
ncbi:MAG: hypothetical protein IJ819_06505 [Clostridiales bacterium]|nr:hypothetical protein [Clostridiales bacterium]